jgi:hypothetical protein
LFAAALLAAQELEGKTGGEVGKEGGREGRRKRGRRRESVRERKENQNHQAGKYFVVSYRD